MLSDIIYHTVNGSGIYVLVGCDNNFNGVILTSPDGNTWTKQTSATSAYTLDSITYANGSFVAVGGNNYSAGTPTYNSVILTSPDAISCTSGITGRNK